MNRAGPARIVVPALAGAAVAAAGAGYVFDGAGSPAVDFWAVTWGVSVFLIVAAVSLLMTGERIAYRRIAKGVLGLVAACIAYGVLWWVLSTGTSPTSLEGAWQWPLGIAALAVALWAIRGAFSREP